MWRFSFLTYSLLAVTLAVCAMGRNPARSFNQDTLEVAEDDISTLWKRTTVLVEWFTENNSVQWLLLHSEKPSQAELIDARRRVGIAEMYQLGLLRPQSAKAQLEKAELLIAQTEPKLTEATMRQAKRVENEIAVASGRVDATDSAEKNQYNRIESDLDRLIDRLNQATP